MRLTYARLSVMERDIKAKVLANKVESLATSIHLHNPDQIGRDAWAGFFEELDQAVTEYCNETRRMYSSESILKPKQQELEADLEKINTELEELKVRRDQLEAKPEGERTRNEMRELRRCERNVEQYELLIPSIELDIDAIQTQRESKLTKEYKGKFPNLFIEELPKLITTKTFNDGYDITYGYVSTFVEQQEWKELFTRSTSIPKPTQFINALLGDEVRGLLRQSGNTSLLEVPDDMTPDGERQLKLATAAINAKESIKTISSAMENVSWSTCTQERNCQMPNKKRTADIAICVLPDQPGKSLVYPILNGEILGDKDKGPPNEQLYAGIASSYQGLSFSPRTVYWEVGKTDCHLYIFQRDPVSGSIKMSKKTYNIGLLPRPGYATPIQVMLNDICRCLFDALINLRPIATYSARMMYASNYRDFMSTDLQSGANFPIQPHCWHLFTPRFKGQKDNVASYKGFLPGDAEDPEMDFTPSAELAEFNDRPEQYPDNMGSDVLPVTEESFNYANLNRAFIENLYPNRACRDEYGDPLPFSQANVKDVRVGAEIALSVARYALENFMRNIVRGGFEVYHEYLSEIIANMTSAGQQQPDEILEDEEFTLEEESEMVETGDRQLYARLDLKNFQPDVTFIQAIQRRTIGAGEYGCEYIDRDVVIRGPQSSPFSGGFIILPSGHLVYIKHLGNQYRIPGFNGVTGLVVDSNVACFLEKIASELGDTGVQVPAAGGGGGGGGVGGEGGDNGGHGRGRPTAPGHIRFFGEGLSNLSVSILPTETTIPTTTSTSTRPEQTIILLQLLLSPKLVYPVRPVYRAISS